MRWSIRLLALSGLLLGPAAPRAGAEDSNCVQDNCVHVNIQPRYRVGQVSGDLQTPKGGGIGTTSPDRPTLKEIGVQLGQEAGVEVKAFWKAHELDVDASVLLLFGNANLHDALVSQEQPFPAGTHVESKTYILFGRAAYRHLISPGGPSSGFGLRPGVGVSAFQFHYQLDGSNGSGTDRKYSHFAPHLELGLVWRPGNTGPVWLSADVRQTLTFLLPETNQTNIFEAVGAIHYDIARNWSLHVEAGFRHFSFRDVQPIPNDVNVDFGPWIGVGLTARF